MLNLKFLLFIFIYLIFFNLLKDSASKELNLRSPVLCKVLGCPAQKQQDILEQVQQRATRIIKGLEHLTSEESPREPV